MSELEAHTPQHSRLTQCRFRAVAPQLMKKGDIVELQVSFIAVPARDNKYRISTVLRSISILDGQFSQVSYNRLHPVQDIKPSNLGCIREKAYRKLSTAQAAKNPEEESRIHSRRSF